MRLRCPLPFAVSVAVQFKLLPYKQPAPPPPSYDHAVPGQGNLCPGSKKDKLSDWMKSICTSPKKLPDKKWVQSEARLTVAASATNWAQLMILSQYFIPIC